MYVLLKLPKPSRKACGDHLSAEVVHAVTRSLSFLIHSEWDNYF